MNAWGESLRFVTGAAANFRTKSLRILGSLKRTSFFVWLGGALKFNFIVNAAGVAGFYRT